MSDLIKSPEEVKSRLVSLLLGSVFSEGDNKKRLQSAIRAIDDWVIYFLNENTNFELTVFEIKGNLISAGVILPNDLSWNHDSGLTRKNIRTYVFPSSLISNEISEGIIFLAEELRDYSSITCGVESRIYI